ncbi:nickel pincer cofactor biosynthesis protein LarC [Sporomusa sp.]|uniref:nickel pincer cofactor biosynthesis protein LarC n=1 Tax=Sporomusa sp. TaxID=2078658 RepID=UPI002BC70632|nr:nickel pincer cofactor biosynthesis protein LarC [Sporomusa sp.]HWR43631.1 nickel pincer cofactor biosynthesis protein LarC [Sporomusa sp.]
MDGKRKIIYLDCFAGISGNMLLGALIDIGAPEELLRAELAKLPVTGYELSITRVDKGGISALYLDVQVDDSGHHHRNLADIVGIIDHSALTPAVKETSKRIFTRLAEVEARVHGVPIDEIHFHEVGAVDSIVDIIGVAWTLDYLGVEQIYASRLHVGSGFVKCCHGLIPVPAPATAELLRGIPFYQGDIAKELVTPTGAAVLATLGEGYGPMPDGFISSQIGYGAGTWELDIPNVLRLYLGEMPADAIQGQIEGQEDKAYLVVEANIDDQNPELYSYIMEKLFDAGALDVWLTPIIMKKGRPATKLSALLMEDCQAKIAEVILEETTSIGMRFYPVTRAVANREFIVVGLPWGDVKVKISSYRGKICNVAPEYEDCRKIAEELGLPLKVIQHLALKEAMSFC